MNKEELLQEIRKRVEQLKVYAEGILSRKEAEDTHQFRVTFKKLRALLRCAHVEKDAKQLPAYNALKERYSAAGVVRDLWLYNNSLVSIFRREGITNAQYNKLLTQRTEEAEQNQLSLLSGFSFDQLIEELAGIMPGGLSGDANEDYINEQISAAQALIKTDATDEELHTIRKHLKDLMYDQRYLVDDKGKNLLDHKAELKKITDLLGDYNDRRVMIEKLDAAVHEDIPQDEKAILENVIKDKKRQKDMLKGRLLMQLPSLSLIDK